MSLLGEENLTVRVSDQASAVRWARETRILSSVTLSHAHVVSVLWWGKKHRKSWLVYRDVYVGTLTHVLQNCSLSIDQVLPLQLPCLIHLFHFVQTRVPWLGLARQRLSCFVGTKDLPSKATSC